MTERISAADAATRLGVKRETIYAYVSRGLLHSERHADGRSSTFDPAEIDRLRRRRNDRRPGRLEVAVASSVTEVSDGHVAYRGERLGDLVAEGRHYEDVAELLWTGVLTEADPWIGDDEVAAVVRRAADALPDHATPTDTMMAGVVAAGAADPFRDDRSVDGVVAMTSALIRSVVDALPAASASPRRPASRALPAASASPRRPASPALPALEEVESDRIAERLWPRLTADSADSWPLLDLALTLLADHGMATSTLAARLAASTRAGPHAVLLAALGAVAGPLHGAASRRVHRLLAHAEQGGADAAIAEVMQRDGRVPGVGHFIHKTRDPRHDLLLDAILASEMEGARLEVVGDVLDRIADRVPVAPNVDFALGALTYGSGMDAADGELIFAISRSAGWLAHALEEYQEAPIRFRPVGRYRPA